MFTRRRHLISCISWHVTMTAKAKYMLYQNNITVDKTSLNIKTIIILIIKDLPLHLLVFLSSIALVEIIFPYLWIKR